MKRSSAFLILFILALFLGSCGQQEPASTPFPKPVPESEVVLASDGAMVDAAPGKPPGRGEVAPNFTYTLPDGTHQTLSDLHGKKVLINFWATWCGPCQVELPEMQRASQEYADDGLVILAINRQETPETIKPFAAKYGVTFPLVVNISNDIGDAYGIRGLPTSYFINTDGTIHYRQIGVVNGDFIQQRIEEMN